MRSFRPYGSLLFAIGFWGMLFAPITWADEILVVTDSFHPVQAAAGVRIIQLDRPHHIKARLSQDLPADPAQSTLLARQRLQEGGTTLQQELITAHQDVIDAWSLGITKIPAIVVDHHFVIYGENDVEKAVARIAQYREAHP